MRYLIQKFIIRIYKGESKIINFALVFFILNAISLSLYLYNRSSDSNLTIINPHPPIPSDEIYAKLLETIDNPPTDGNFFASKSGKYYYPKNCSVGQKIKKEKRVWFTNEIQAISSGYAKFSGCK